jgi:Domain of unknown function (DUF4352)
MNTKLAIGISLACMLTAALACSSDSTGPTAGPYLTSTPLITAPPDITGIPEITEGVPSLADTPVPEVTTAPASVGVRVESAGVALTVNKVSTATSIQQFLTPQAGNIYLVLDVTIENTGQDAGSYNALYFKVKDANNFEYDTALAAPDPSLKSGDSNKGDKVRGNVAFELPIGAKALVMSYDPLVLFGGYQIIRVNLGDVPAAK